MLSRYGKVCWGVGKVKGGVCGKVLGRAHAL